MIKRKNIFIVLIFLCSAYISCRGMKKDIQFSFKKIQDYYQEIESSDSTCLNPFYIDESFFTNTEQQLNELIKESDYCSLLIRSSIDNGICEVRALYNYSDGIFFYSWNCDGIQKQTKIQNPKAKEILKNKPKDKVKIDGDKFVVDGISEYIIKKINNKTFYYANHCGSVDMDYEPLIDLFYEN